MHVGLRGVLAALVIVCCRVQAEGAALVVISAWSRELPPGQNTAAIYMQLRNDGDALVQVRGVRVAGSASASIHQSTQVQGMMRMHAVPVLEMAPGETVDLQPGGYHVMVFGLQNPARAGEKLPFCLLLHGGGEQCSEALIKGLGDQHG